VCNREVRNDRLELTTERRERGERPRQPLRELDERCGRLRSQKSSEWEATYSCEGELEAARVSKRIPDLPKNVVVHGLGIHERKEHGDVCRDTKTRNRMKSISKRPYSRLGLGDADDKTCLGHCWELANV